MGDYETKEVPRIAGYSIPVASFFSIVLYLIHVLTTIALEQLYPDFYY
jgi:hypothetical protein